MSDEDELQPRCDRCAGLLEATEEVGGEHLQCTRCGRHVARSNLD